MDCVFSPHFERERRLRAFRLPTSPLGKPLRNRSRTAFPIARPDSPAQPSAAMPFRSRSHSPLATILLIYGKQGVRSSLVCASAAHHPLWSNPFRLCRRGAGNPPQPCANTLMFADLPALARSGAQPQSSHFARLRCNWALHGSLARRLQSRDRRAPTSQLACLPKRCEPGGAADFCSRRYGRAWHSKRLADSERRNERPAKLNGERTVQVAAAGARMGK